MFDNIIITFGYESKIDYNRTWLVQLYMVHCIPVSFALPLCLSFLAYYLLKLGHCDSRCRCRFPGPSEGPSCNFIALCLYHMLLFCSLSLCTLCMYFYLFASHVFRFVSFYFVCYVLLSFPFCISLHLPHATKNSMEILFFFFFLFCFVLVGLGAPEKLIHIREAATIIFAYKQLVKHISQSPCPLFLSPSLSLERCCPISFRLLRTGFSFSQFSVWFSVLFFFCFRLYVIFFFMLSLSSCPAALLCLVAFISI